MFADDTEIHNNHSDLSTVEQTLQADIQNAGLYNNNHNALKNDSEGLTVIYTDSLTYIK